MALSNQLLNHFKEKFGIVTVVNAVFYEVDGSVPKIAFDTLKMSNISSEGQQKEIRGGQGAELLLQYDFGRTANVEITDALVSVGSLEYLFGGQQNSQTSIQYLRQAEFTVNTLVDVSVEDNLMTLGYKPADAAYDTTKAVSVLYALPNGQKGQFTGTLATTDASIDLPVGTKLSVFYTGELYIGTNKKITGTFGATPALDSQPTDYVAGTDVVVVVRDIGGGGSDLTVTKDGAWPTVADFSGEAEGDAYEIYYQSKNYAASVKEMILRASDFPPIVRMVGETVVLDADTGRKIALQIEIPKLKLNANFTFSFDAEGDPSVFDFSGVALAHRGELLKIRTLGEISEIN